MPIRGPLIAPALRLRIGASVLSAAQAVDTRPVKERLARFEREHQRYVEAQEKVAAIEVELRAARRRLSECDALQDKAVQVLAGALIVDGHRIRNPFAALGAPSLSRLARLPFADGAVAVHRLVGAIRRETPISRRTAQAAQAADKAARAVEQAIIGVEKVEASVRAARQTRDAIGHGWHAAYAALRHVARAAGDEGAPQLHAMLFGPPPRATAKRKRRMVATATVPKEAPSGSDSPASA